MSKFVLSAFADEIDTDLNMQMDVLDKHHIEYIEMRGVNGKGLVEYSLDDVKDIKKQLDRRGFKLSSVGSPIGKIKITDDFEPHLSLFNHTLKIAEIMEAPYIRLFSFFIPEDHNPEDYRDDVLSKLGEFIKAVKDNDIVLLHENEKDIYGDTAERCLDLFNSLQCSYFRAVFDPANFIQCGVESYPHAYNLLKEHIEYLHIKDALSSNHTVVPVGHGDGRIKEILEDLWRSGWKGFLSLEPHLQAFKGFAKLELDPCIKELPESGEKTFAVAADALNSIISTIKKEN